MQNQYPRWKNVSLILLLALASIYAIPSLFGDDPAVQVSAASIRYSDSGGRPRLDKEALLERVRTVLTANNFAYLELEPQAETILVRFRDEDTQIAARDQIKADLGDDYAVALNLISRTPKWLRKLGAYPVKLGLDLRGGVHFLLAVDLEEMVGKKEEISVRSVAADLRAAGVRYLAVEQTESKDMVVTFSDADCLRRGTAELEKKLRDSYRFRKVIEPGTAKLHITLSEVATSKLSDQIIEQTVQILSNRVNELGISEAIVQRQGQKYVSIDLPGIQDTTRAKELLGKTATLKFQLVDTEHEAEAALAGNLPLGSKLYQYQGRRILLKDQVVLHGSAITYAAASVSAYGQPAVAVRLGGGGENVFHQVTTENIGNPLAVVYTEIKTEQRLVDGKLEIVNKQEERVISVATIQSALGNQFEISGLESAKYAEGLAVLLRSGALIAPVTIVQEITVGPSMGKANIHRGILSIAVGYLLVMVFMMIYYRFFGVIANVAFFCNLVFMLAVLSILGATLTLPGIAGMVLTVGLAVDANVLIYERIREELRNGSGIQASIYNGYQRAFATIVDANVATLIVALVLFALGIAAVKGFAVVLVIGLITSMLTSIVYTRAVANWVYGGRNVKKISIGV